MKGARNLQDYVTMRRDAEAEIRAAEALESRKPDAAASGYLQALVTLEDAELLLEALGHGERPPGQAPIGYALPMDRLTALLETLERWSELSAAVDQFFERYPARDVPDSWLRERQRKGLSQARSAGASTV